MRRVLIACSFVVLVPVVVFAQAEVVLPDPSNIGGFATAVLAAFDAKNWAVLVALGLSAGLWAVRTYLLPTSSFLQTDRGGAILVLGSGVATSIAAAAAAPNAGGLSRVIVSGMLMAFTSAGAFVIFKKIIFPSDTPVKAKASDVKGFARSETLAFIGLCLLTLSACAWWSKNASKLPELVQKEVEQCGPGGVEAYGAIVQAFEGKDFATIVGAMTVSLTEIKCLVDVYLRVCADTQKLSRALNLARVAEGLAPQDGPDPGPYARARAWRETHP